MRIGYCTWGMKHVDIEEALPAIAQIGYQGIELAVSPGRTTELYTLDAAKRVRIAQLLDQYNLGLTDYDLRYSRSILRDYGNLSSASFLFSYQELAREDIAREGDWGVAIAMGPGVSIETALLRW